MKVNHEKLLRALLAKAYKKQDGEIDEILNSSEEDGHESALASILDLDSARITALKKPANGQTFQDGYAKGKKEVLSNFEKELKEKFDIESDAEGLDLVETVIAAKAKPGKALTDDDVKRHPVYQTLDKASKKALADKETEFTTKLTEQESKFKKAQTFQTVGKKAVDILNGLNPVLPTNPKVSETLKSAFLKEFEGYEYEPQDDGRILVFKDGKLLEDKHGHSEDFASMVKTKAADFFEFKANNGGTNSGNGKPGDKKPDGGTPPAGDKTPYKAKDENDLLDFMSDYKNSPADRVAAQNQWDADHSPAQ